MTTLLAPTDVIYDEKMIDVEAERPEVQKNILQERSASLSNLWDQVI